MDKQHEMKVVNPRYPTTDCNRFKYKNEWGTEVLCKGTVTWQKALSDGWLVGHCDTCSYQHGRQVR